MKIAITAGIKTANITDAVINKISSSGDDLVTLPSINDLIEYIDCGYKINRIIIIEQAITSNGEIESKEKIRSIINGISSIISKRQANAEVVFITRYDDLADVIYEESLSVRSNSIIVVKDRPYSTSFFISIMTDELKSIDKDIVYNVKGISTDDTDTESDADDEWEEYEAEDEDSSDWQDEETEANTNDEEGVESEELDNEWDDDNQDEDAEYDWDDNEQDEGSEDDWDDDSIDADFGNESDIGSYESTDNIQQNITDDDGEEWDNKDDEIYNQTVEAEKQGDSSNIEISDSNSKNIEHLAKNEIDDIAEKLCMNIGETSNGSEVNTDEEWTDDIYDSKEQDTNDDVPSEQNEAYNIEENIYSSTDDREDEIDSIYKENAGDRKSRSSRGGLFGRTSSRKDRAKSYDGITVNIDGGITTAELAHRMESFASRGNSIVVTGSGGTGTSTIAINMANFIASIGYSVIVIDMDTKHRAQSYMTKEAYNAIEPGSSDLMSTINSGAPAERFARIIRPGIHMLSMWMGGDCVNIEDIIKREKITRFINSLKTSYNFTIYDIPFDIATGFLQDITFTADNIVNVVDCSNWGITKFMLDCCNISSEEMQEAIFNRTEIIMNKCHKETNSILGRKVRKFTDILNILDDKVIDLTGVDSGMYFTNMHIVGGLEYNNRFESGWYSDNWFSDTKEGRQIFAQLVAETILY